ncbi:choice-of-anchor tandem repeat GloVer-containing protein [Ekhidna sp.]|uniref:choice-of-anchor tandem repeat GloVer-containing protein n=1 Tax=Ekhidna sp. TaxID=2608089 RepID=UPI00351331C1
MKFTTRVPIIKPYHLLKTAATSLLISVFLFNSYSQTRITGTTISGGGHLFSVNVDESELERWIDFTFEKHFAGNLARAGERLYGMALGGKYGHGVIFSLALDGSDYQKLYDFEGIDGSLVVGSVTSPQGHFVNFEGKLWASLPRGGNDNSGVIISYDLIEKAVNVIHHFNDETDGSLALGSLINEEGKFFGVTTKGGSNDFGTLFQYDPSESSFSILHQFEGGNPMKELTYLDGKLYGIKSSVFSASFRGFYRVNVDGTDFEMTSTLLVGNQEPNGLIHHNGKLWGTSKLGGSGNDGTIFKLNPDGTDFEFVYEFDEVSGKSPAGRLLIQDNSLLGITTRGGENDRGVIYSIDPETSSFSKLHDLSDQIGSLPHSGLSAFDSKLFCLTSFGGSIENRDNGFIGYGSVITMDLDGNNLEKKYTFGTNKNGSYPLTPLLDLDDWIYGATSEGGIEGNGTIYKIKKDGSHFSTIHSFENFNGRFPLGNLVLYNERLFGITKYGGDHDGGVIYSINKDGSDFNIIFHFEPNTSGIQPSTISLIDGQFWGTVTRLSDEIANSLIFRLNADGTEFQHVYSFSDGLRAQNNGNLIIANSKIWGKIDAEQIDFDFGPGILFSINSEGGDFHKERDFTTYDGRIPEGNLLLHEDEVWGITKYGGSNGNEWPDDDQGVVYKINTDGTGFTLLHSFIEASGMNPVSGLKLLDNKMWGVTERGGENGLGVIYSISLDGYLYNNEVLFTEKIGNGPNHFTVYSTKVDPELEIEFIPEKEYGDDSFVINITSENATPANLYSSAESIVKLEGGMATIMGAGTVLIIAEQNSTSEFFYTSDTISLTIEKAPLTVTVDDQSKVYGEANPEFKVSYTGFVNGEDAGSLTTIPTANTLADESSEVGTYAITASGGTSENYAFTYVDGIMTVEEASLTVAADDHLINEGEALPELTITYSGFVNGEDANSLISKPVATMGITDTNTAGTFTISVSGGVSDNYVFKYVSGTLTIKQVLGLDGQETITVYPNPAVDYIKIDSRHVKKVELYDLRGTKALTSDDVNQQINLKTLDKGLYLIRLYNENGKVIGTERFIKN